MNFYSQGLQGLISSLSGCILPVLSLIAFYSLRMLGAGDIKLFSAIGSIMGVTFVLNTLIYSFLMGGVISLTLMLTRKNLKPRLLFLFAHIKGCILTQSIQPYPPFSEQSDMSKFKFSYAIACGTIIAFLCIS